ncbi:MAG: xanthine dehydrogenase family protein molybdopterin-binding subunit [Bryobacteraceae bacterium]|nr:xanthine dehydrogenase family protein molybdopterin-binding subunit [Bryobacteraceae bacterium]
MNVDRRDFLKIVPGAGAGLYLGFALGTGKAQTADAAFQPNAWLGVGADGVATLVFAKSEMGQGVMTALPTILADEMEADWTKVKVVQGDADNKKYGSQSTGGSDSVKGSWRNLRRAGAAAREMMVLAAAEKWGVPAAECRAENGNVLHSSGKKLSYGELAESAAKQKAPAEPKLKDAKDFRYIGKKMPRVDIPAKVNGSAKFGMDFKIDGMVTAVVARCPVPGGKVKSFDAAKAKAMRGVVDVVQLSDSKIAVVADGYWNAMEARKALTVVWDEGDVAKLTQDGIWNTFRELAKKEAVVNRNDGSVDQAMGAAARKLEAEYTVPYEAHSPMEPGNCTAWVRNGEAELWAPTQVANTVHANVAKMLAIPPEKVKVHITLLGGGFGRRLLDDYAQEAVLASQKTGKPVKVIWSREDDMQHSHYRPASLHKMSGAVDASGNITAWGHTMVCPSIFASLGFPVRNGNDPQVSRQMVNLYNIPNVKLAYVQANNGIPVSWWRSVYHSQTNFVEECFFDELCALAGKDPYEARIALLDRAEVKTAGDTFDARRLKAVLQSAATRAGWGKPAPKGRFRGIACCTAFGSYTALVAEVSVDANGYKVHKVTGAMDVGQYVNPDTLAAQFESSVIFAMSAMKNEVTIQNGRVVQSNFHDYPMVRMNEAPAFDIDIIKSDAPPGGAGEPVVPIVAPAIANAIFAATGKRLRSMPVDLKKA